MDGFYERPGVEGGREAFRGPSFVLFFPLVLSVSMLRP